jgi:hypothetical protein
MRTMSVLWCFVALGGLCAVSGEKVTPVLAPDPAVMRIINSLGAGQSARLPRFKTTGDINAVARKWKMHERGPGSRDYCIKMVWMPDRKRAIFCGANHAVPHRLNDVWEYDLPSNTWVCLYGPDKNKNWKKENWDDVVKDKNGIFRTKRGGPANIGHTWWNITYDPKKRALLWLCSWGIDPKFAKELRRKMGARAPSPPLWLFYPEQRRWERVIGSKFDGKRPRYENARALEYVPELGGTVWTATAGMWLYDSKTNTWKDLKPNGGDKKAFGANAPRREQVMAYLPDKKMLVGHSGFRRGAMGKGLRAKTSQYLTERNEWKLAFEGKPEDEIPGGHDAFTNFAYDSVGKVCLLWDTRWTKALWAYDPDTLKWTKLKPKGPPPSGGKLAYYDPARNVFVVNGSWVYRHKKRGKVKKSSATSGTTSHSGVVGKAKPKLTTELKREPGAAIQRTAVER